MAVSLPVDMDASWPAQSGRTAGAEAIEADVMIDQALAPSPPGAPGQARTAAVGLDKIQGALLHPARSINDSVTPGAGGDRSGVAVLVPAGTAASLTFGRRRVRYAGLYAG